MDILSDVKISGRLTAVGDVNIMGNLDMVSSGGTKAMFCKVIFGGGDSTLDLTGAKVVGLNTYSFCVITIPSNCSTFVVDTNECTNSGTFFNYESPVTVSSFIQDGDDWKQVQLDISFIKCSSGKYGLKASFSQAFSENKTMKFITG